jgi:hypothetical protein
MADEKIYRYGLRDLWIAEWLDENSYGTAFRVFAAKSFTVSLVVQAAMLEGDDIEVDTFAKVKSVEAQLRHGSLSLAALEALTGGTLYEYAGYRDMAIGQDEDEIAPYFSVAGRVMGTAAGDTHLWIPKAKINGNLSYQAQENNYLVPEVNIKGVREGDINGMLRIRHHTTQTSISIPIT